jgi:hypothetical protein
MEVGGRQATFCHFSPVMPAMPMNVMIAKGTVDTARH